MIEIIILLVVLGGFRETAKRRGTVAWPFIVAGAVGWLLGSTIGPVVVGPGPHFLLSWGWVGLTYVSIFVIGGGGRRMKDAWQCPDCRAFNPPSTLVCLCGFDPARPIEGASLGEG